MTSNRRIAGTVGLVVLCAGALTVWDATVTGAPVPDDGVIRLLRVPHSGIQPMAQVDAAGTLHLLYFNGDPSAGDVFYVTRRAEATAFSAPLRVNSQPNSVIAIGTVRGAHLALGADGRPHVAWMGSAIAQPRGPDGQTPMLYTRLTDSGTRFEAQRNVVTHAFGLDGGGTLAAGGQGRVSVLWHADAGRGGEEHRRVWMTTSTDGGNTFAPEVAVSESGVCGCCGMSATVDRGGTVRALYRAFRPPESRDMYLLTSDDSGSEGHLLETWRIGACPMSTSSITATDEAMAIAWETDGEVAWALLDRQTSAISAPLHPPKQGGHRKHPGVALTGEGRILFVWTEGMAWSRGGTLHWQGYDSQGHPTQISGSRGGVPVWSRPAVVADTDGTFTIIY